MRSAIIPLLIFFFVFAHSDAAPPNTPGILDTSFDSDGIWTANTNSTATETASAVIAYYNAVSGALSGYYVGGRALIGGVYYWTLYEVNRNGGPSAPVTHLTSGSTGDTLTGLALTPEGDLIACGLSSFGGKICRFNLSENTWNRETNFGTNGCLTANPTSGSDRFNACAVDSSGRIVAAGTCNNDFCVARYDSNGNPDNSFSDDGYAFADFGSTDQAWDMAIASNGKIYLAGRTNVDHVISGGMSVDDDFAVACFDGSNGAPCADQGGSGRFTWDAVISNNDQAFGIVIDGSGNLVVSGESTSGSDAQGAVARFSQDPMTLAWGFDPSFNSGAPLLLSQLDRASDVKIRSADGAIFVSGLSDGRGSNPVWIALNSDGSFHLSFSPAVRVQSSIFSNDYPALEIQSDFKIVMAGSTLNVSNSTSDFLVLRSLADDRDGDGDLDAADNCPDVANADQGNLDGDSQGDLCDPDDDNDTICSRAEEVVKGVCTLNKNGGEDNCPFASNVDQLDTDNDGSGNACDADDDNDGILDAAPDLCPLNFDPLQIDTDEDGLGNACDDDDDGDGVADKNDNCLTDPNPDQIDSDGDGTGDLCDGDLDGDDVEKVGIDNCPAVSNRDQLDNDLDMVGDACDTDDDNDGQTDMVDNCPLIANTDQLNTDDIGGGDACDDDDDNDGELDAADNCPLVSNRDQLNTDGLNDGGDLCDPDDDNDTVADVRDNCPFAQNREQEDLDEDGIGDLCDGDRDSDGLADERDNCPNHPNKEQENQDQDRQGDACDDDDDNDEKKDLVDNCPLVANADQADLDANGIGDACDPEEEAGATRVRQTATSGIAESEAEPANKGDSDKPSEETPQREGPGAPAPVRPGPSGVGNSACTLIPSITSHE